MVMKDYGCRLGCPKAIEFYQRCPATCEMAEEPTPAGASSTVHKPSPNSAPEKPQVSCESAVLGSASV
jgi:hypothetical protein